MKDYSELIRALRECADDEEWEAVDGTKRISENGRLMREAAAELELVAEECKARTKKP